MSWLSGWRYRYPFTVSNTYISSPLTDFPLLVYLSSDSRLSDALATGHDIRFTQSDGITLCGYERALWSGGGGSAGTLTAYMKAPSLASSASTTFYMYLGKPGASDVASTTAAWDASYKAVYHLQESGFNYADSIIGATLNTGSAPTRTTGVYGYAQSFNGSGNYLQGSDAHLPLGSTDRTISCLANTASLSNAYVWDYGTAGTYNAFACLDINVSSWFASQWGQGVWGGTPVTNTWYHMSVTIAASMWAIRVNGASAGSSNTLTTNTIASKLRIGCAGESLGGYWNGLQQEYRFSNIARSAAWLTFEAKNLLSAGNQISWGDREQATVSASLLPHYTRRREMSGGMLC